MQINSFELLPTPETIIKIDEKIFYATVKGVNIVEFSPSGIDILYTENSGDLWGAFHFSIVFQGNIFFLPHKFSYVIKYDIIQKQIEKIPIGGMQKGEFICPVVNGNIFMILGCSSGNVCRWTDKCKFEKVSQVDLGNGQWKLNRQDVQMENLCFCATNKGEIVLLNKENLEIKRIHVYETGIWDAARDEHRIFYISESGCVYFYDNEYMNANYIFGLEFPVSNLSRFICWKHSAYLLPRIGNQIYVINENLEITIVNLEVDLTDKSISWTVYEDGFIGITQNIDAPWKGELKFFLYNPLTNILSELPFEGSAIKYLFHKNIKNGLMFQEDKNNNLKEYLKLIKVN